MIVDFLSDLHLDFYFTKNNRIKDEDIFRLFNPIITKNNREVGEVLIIAGDIGHYNWQNIRVLKYLKDHYYKHIICVLGNHDYYLIDHESKLQFKDSFERVNNMRKLINQELNMYCLDGDVIEIEGIKFAGCDSWYNEGYFLKQYPTQNFSKEIVNKLWKGYVNDSNLIYGIENFDDIWKIEEPKIESIYKECDVMITHINPSCKDAHISERFQNNASNIFFSFEGEKYRKNGSMKYWIFGHTHEELTYIEDNVNCCCNPLGYPGESGYGKYVMMQSFEIGNI